MSAVHDPLCNAYDESRALCNCGPGSLIARVVERERSRKDTPIREDHDPLCFPAIRDVRMGDWGPSCFTCEVIGMAEDRGRADERQKARQRVEALPVHATTEGIRWDAAAAAAGGDAA